jgi:hypothetical protein
MARDCVGRGPVRARIGAAPTEVGMPLPRLNKSVFCPIQIEGCEEIRPVEFFAFRKNLSNLLSVRSCWRGMACVAHFAYLEN